MSICKPVNVPQPDNSEMECDSFIKTKCVIKEDAISYLNLPANSTLEDILAAYLASLIDARNRIHNLENP